MPTFTPGPSTLADPFVPYRPVVVGTPFQAMGVALVNSLRAFDTLVGDRMRIIGTLGDDDLSFDYGQDVGPALGALDQFGDLNDGKLLTSVLGNTEAALVDLTDQASDLPDPFARPPDVGEPPPDATPAPPKEIIAAPPADGPDDPILDPTGVHTVVVAWFVDHFHTLPSDAQLGALAAAAGYLQGTSVPRSFVVNFLSSPAALAALGV